MREILVTLDIETTGLENPDVVQLAAISGNGKVLINSMCIPNKPIEPDASAVHGVFKEDVVGFPESKTLVGHLSLLLYALGENSKVITSGYNTLSFDLPVLYKINPDIKDQCVHHIDVYVIVLRYLSQYGTKLVDVYENYCAGDASNAHDASADCRFTNEVLAKFMLEKGWTYSDVLKDLSKPRAYHTMPFGKHQGIPVKDVPRQYIRWANNNWTDKSPDMQATFDSVLKRR